MYLQLALQITIELIEAGQVGSILNIRYKVATIVIHT
jgi:hypothetical protein